MTNRVEDIRADFRSINPESGTVCLMRADIEYLLDLCERQAKVVEAAVALRKHWNDEFAHFACGGEAILLEALARLEQP